MNTTDHSPLLHDRPPEIRLLPRPAHRGICPTVNASLVPYLGALNTTEVTHYEPITHIDRETTHDHI
jgi:hypothetical protein